MHAERLVRRVPEIEVFGKLAERSVRQDMVPPGIVLRSGHVVWHDVQEYAQTIRARAGDETGPGGLTPEVRTDPRGIRDVVSMAASGNRLQAGRQIHMADSQIGQ